MFKKYLLFLFMLVFFSPFSLVSANLIINEVMYDLSGSDSTNSKSREWIEIYNSGSSDVAVDASSWRIYDGGANRTMNGEVNFSIPASGYIILAGDKDTFLGDFPNFSGIVYDTGITSLNNTGATLKLLDQDQNTVDTFTYSSSLGGAGDGNSLQKISGSWTGGVPTPGVTNDGPSSQISSTNSGVNTTSGNSSGSSSSTSNTSAAVVKKPTEEAKITTQITGKTLVFAGLPAIFQAKAFGYEKEQLRYGKFFWNFGDGDSREANANFEEKFSHTYFYPGDYLVTLEYYRNYYGDTPDAFDKIIVKVVPSDVVISSVGSDQDFFVELTNNALYDADISGWMLSGETKNFYFSRNTIIAAKKKIILSSNLTHFSFLDKNFLKLINSQGNLVFDYSAINFPVKKEANSPAVRTVSNISKKDSIKVAELPEVLLGNLAAAPISAPLKQESSENSLFMIISALVLIGGSAGAVYFIRQRRIIAPVGSDFNIIDE